MSADEILRLLTAAVRQGWLVQIDYTEHDGFRVYKRHWNTEFGGFISADTLEDAIVERFEE